jgi:hypothetical protein
MLVVSGFAVQSSSMTKAVDMQNNTVNSVVCLNTNSLFQITSRIKSDSLYKVSWKVVGVSYPFHIFTSFGVPSSNLTNDNFTLKLSDFNVQQNAASLQYDFYLARIVNGALISSKTPLYTKIIPLSRASCDSLEVERLMLQNFGAGIPSFEVIKNPIVSPSPIPVPVQLF